MMHAKLFYHHRGWGGGGLLMVGFNPSLFPSLQSGRGSQQSTKLEVIAPFSIPPPLLTFVLSCFIQQLTNG